MSKRTPEQFAAFKNRIQKEVMNHRIIENNEYAKWFANADLSLEDVRHFTVQFSVFSNLFLIAQLKKMINSFTLDEMRASKEILASEIGAIFKKKGADASAKQTASTNFEDDGDPELVGTEGTVDGGTFRFRAAHFEWLLGFGKPLGLGFSDLGKRRHGTPSTLHFCDELERIYGSEDFNTAAGASFSVENWAAAGFWKQLVQGLKSFKKNHVPELQLNFFTWHDKVEDQHAEHTEEELEEIYFLDEFNEDAFIKAANEMLNGVAVFWDGLNQERLKRKAA